MTTMIYNRVFSRLIHCFHICILFFHGISCTNNIILTLTYIPALLKRYSFILPSAWPECWWIAQGGQSIQFLPWILSTSNWQYFHSWNAFWNVVLFIVPVFKIYNTFTITNYIRLHHQCTIIFHCVMHIHRNNKLQDCCNY